MDKKDKKNHSFSNSMKKIGSTSKNTGSKFLNAIKELPNLPWDKLPKEGYLALIFALIGIIAIFVIFTFLL